MKIRTSIFLVSTLAAGLLRADEDGAFVRFSNNDRLQGSLVSLTPDTLVWKSPVLEKPASFLLSKVIDLSLPATHKQPEADHVAVVTLRRGDVIRGQLASVTDKVVSLDTWFAGRMNFNRLMVADLKIEGQMNYTYRGPDSLEGWKQSVGKPAWTYSRGAFRSEGAGSIARPDLLPEECSVSFDAAWKSDSFSLKVILFSDEPEEDSTSSGYEVSFQRGSIYLRNCKTQAFLGSTHSQALAEYDKVRIELRASSKTGKVCLYINDRIIEVWTDPDMAKGKFGKALHFVTQNSMPVRISGIGVAPWDGVIEKMPEPRIGGMRQFGIPVPKEEPKPAKEKSEKGRMELANGDTIAGEVTSIEEGRISIKTSLGEVKVPVARFRTITLPEVNSEEAIRKQGDIRAWFPDGSSIVFRLDEVGDGTLTGYSQNFGTATFKMEAFSRIEFNIYEPEFEGKWSTGDW